MCVFAKKIIAHNLEVTECLNFSLIVVVFVMKSSKSAAVDCLMLFKWAGHLYKKLKFKKVEAPLELEIYINGSTSMCGSNKKSDV